MHAYGLMYVLAVTAAILITRRRWARAGGDPDLAYRTAMWAFPAGLIGGRIYFLITTPSQIPDHWWGPFAIWQGGLGIWGGVAAGAATAIWYLRKQLPKGDLPRFADAVAPALLVAQAIGRLGNYFNQELFGAPSSCPGRSRSLRPTGRPDTSSTRRSSPRSCTSSTGTSLWPHSSYGSGTIGASRPPACSRCTSPATRPSGSSRRPSGSTTPCTY